MNEKRIPELIAKALAGDEAALASVLEEYHPRLKRMVDLHIDHRAQRTVTVDQVVDEACADVAGRLGEYEDESDLPFYLWVRKLTAERLASVHDEYLSDASGNVGLEIRLHRGRMPQTTSFALASKLIGKLTESQDETVRAERKVKLQSILNAMDPNDREVLAMRHFEQLTSKETATILGVSETVAGMRFLRALRRLKQEMAQMPGLMDDDDPTEIVRRS